MEICVRRLGYHKYKDVWDSFYMGDSFITKHEQNNRHNKNEARTFTHNFTRHVHERSYYLRVV